MDNISLGRKLGNLQVGSPYVLLEIIPEFSKDFISSFLKKATAVIKSKIYFLTTAITEGLLEKSIEGL